MRLGKLAATYDGRDLRLAHYLTGALPRRPAHFGHEKLVGAEWLMLGNGPDDTVRPGFAGAGDCVWAGAAHETMMWCREAGRPARFTGANAVSDYSAATGYVIGDDLTDGGTDVREAMKYRAKTGVVDAGGARHRIGAYLALEPGNLDHLLEALYLFGAVGIGIEFPNSAMDQFDRGRIWSVAHGASSDGGHYVPLVARRAHLECVTWGRLQPMTLGFYARYCDEAWVAVSEDALRDGRSPEGFDLAALQADLLSLRGRG